MSTNFPSNLDNGVSLPYPTALSKRNSPSLASINDNQNDAVIATQTKLGIGASTPTASNLLVGTGAGTSTWSKLAPTGVIVGSTDTQTLTNKTLTSPTITSPIITNATLSTDLVAGFTTSNSGTVFGVPVTAGVLQTANTVNGSALVSNTITGSKISSYLINRSNNGIIVTETLARILTGWGVITPGVAPSGTAIITFTGGAFTNLPIINISGAGDNASSVVYGSGGPNIKFFLTEATAITSSGFTAYVRSADGTSWGAGNTVFFTWTAIGN